MMSKAVVLVAAMVFGWVQAPSPKPQAPNPWREASPGYVFSFPRDHASHPDNKIEWWYYTGNVKAADGRRFGYQITFFRIGIVYAPSNPSKWAVRDLYMTHLAVSDAKGQRYRYAEKLSRGGPGLAGAAADRYHVWNDGWSAMLVGNREAGTGSRESGVGRRESGVGSREPGVGSRAQHKLVASSPQAAIDLLLDEGKAPVIHGINGINQKGAQPGNASHYYSLTRMPTKGTIAIDGERFEVTGETWMDHEFSTSFLEPEQRGWDWMSIQLSDNREIMLYVMRRADGQHDPRSSGTLVDANGKSIHLADKDFTLTPGRATFTSKNGAAYPVEWTVTIPSHNISLQITTPLKDQELSLEQSTGIAYWEGMIDVAGRAGSQVVGSSGRQVVGSSGSQVVTGSGYLEMTGYHGSLGRVLAGQ